MSFWFKTTVKGGLYEVIKQVLIGPNNGKIDIFEGEEGGDGPSMKLVIGEKISIIGVINAKSVSEKMQIDVSLNSRIFNNLFNLFGKN